MSRGGKEVDQGPRFMLKRLTGGRIDHKVLSAVKARNKRVCGTCITLVTSIKHTN